MEQPTQLRISSPAESAQIIPYLVGFTPQESLVISAIQDGRIQVTARVDLADVLPGGAAENLLDRIWSRFPDADAHAVAYTADHETAWKLLARCDAWLPYGCQAMVIDANTWHTPDGASGTIDPYGTLAAQATYHGLQRLGSRADLETRFTSAPDSDQLDLHLGKALVTLPYPGDTSQLVELTHDLLARNLPSTSAMSVGDAVQLSVLAQDPDVRDLALVSISRDNATDHLKLWQGVIQASPAYGADMSLYLAGMAAWISGDGASATIALERSLAAEPQHVGPHPARLLEGIIDNVIPPTAWDSLRRDIADHAHPDVKQALPAPDQPAPDRGWPPARPHQPGPRNEPTHRKPPAPGISI